MGIRKSMEEEIVVTGDRSQWLSKCATSLKSAGFTKVNENTTIYQIEASYKKFMTWGSLVLPVV